MMSVVSKQRYKKERNELDRMSTSSNIETEYDIVRLERYSCQLSVNSFIPTTTRKNEIKQTNLFKFRQNFRLFMII